MGKPKAKYVPPAGGRGIGLVTPVERTDVLVKRSSGGKPPRRRIRHQLYDAPPPGGVVVDPGPPRVPEARDVFTAGELGARIEALAELHAAADPGSACGAECWACGERCPAGNQVACAGWHSRPLGCHTIEVYCPACFAEWGWPPVPGEGKP